MSKVASVGARGSLLYGSIEHGGEIGIVPFTRGLSCYGPLEIPKPIDESIDAWRRDQNHLRLQFCESGCGHDYHLLLSITVVSYHLERVLYRWEYRNPLQPTIDELERRIEQLRRNGSPSAHRALAKLTAQLHEVLRVPLIALVRDLESDALDIIPDALTAQRIADYRRRLELQADEEGRRYASELLSQSSSEKRSLPR